MDWRLGFASEALGLEQGTLSSRNADGNGDAETCEKTGERTPLFWKFTNIKAASPENAFSVLSSLLTLLFCVLCLLG